VEPSKQARASRITAKRMNILNALAAIVLCFARRPKSGALTVLDVTRPMFGSVQRVPDRCLCRQRLGKKNAANVG